MRQKVFAGAGCLLILLLLLYSRSRGPDSVPAPERPRAVAEASAQNKGARFERWRRLALQNQNQSAEEFIQEKVARFARSRRALAAKLGEQNGVSMTPEIEAFFAAVESGDWDRIQATFTVINGGDSSAGHARTRSPEVTKMWPAIIDAYGAAEQSHLMPAESLLDYGYSILDSLRPGMVYVGGTDSSRWIPALLNDTAEDPKHIVITQNGLADSGYLDYVKLQFADQMQTLSQEESHALYDIYAADALRRAEHDRNFPDEPKQLRRAEEVKMVDGKIDISGRDAVFDMNERLLNKLMEKNPELTFAIAESIPLPGTYADAIPLGPLMELRANAVETFTPERATESLDYWRGTAQAVLSHPESSASDYALKNYSHDAAASGRLLEAHGFAEQAEETYALAQKLFPASPEAAVSLAQFYERTSRASEGQHLLQRFVKQYPSQQKTLRDFWGIEIKENTP